MMELLNRAQVKYITDRCITDSKVLDGMILIDALNTEDELSEDAMLSEDDMDNIILALSVCMYATLYV